ncbi:MAG: O-antigen ligase family protein [Motiliproteus sp.]
MLNTQNLALNQRFQVALSLCVVLFTVLTLMLERGNSYAGALLIIVALAAIVQNRSHIFNGIQNEKLFIAGMAVYACSGVLSSAITNSGIDVGQIKNHMVFLYALLVFLAVRNVGINREYLYAGFFLGAISAGIFGAYQVYVLGHNVAHGHHWKIIFGNTSLILGLLSLTYLIPSHSYQQKRWFMALAVIAFLFGGLGSLCSGTRGGWLALPLLMWLIFSRSITNKAAKFTVYTLFIISLLGIYNFNGLVNQKVNRAISEIEYYTTTDNPKGAGSLAARFEMWRGAAHMFKESPWIGIGFGEFSNELTELKNAKIVNTVTWHPHAHNDVMNAAAEKGIIGIAGLLALYLTSLIYFQRRTGIDLQIATAGSILCLGFIDFGLSETVMIINIGAKFFAVLLAVLAGYLCFLARYNKKTESSISPVLKSSKQEEIVV